jgi:uncharacterized protein YbaP (TraB family)
MKRRYQILMSSIIVLFTLLALLTTSPGCKGGESATATRSKAFIWKVTSNTTSVYLLGSIHVARPELYPLDEAIEDAFDSADYLAVEINLLEVEPLYVSLLVVKYGLYPVGEGLEDNIDEELYNSYENAVIASGVNFEDFEQYRPWVLYISNTQTLYENYDYEVESGLDIHFMEKAFWSSKEIVGLETAEYQIIQLSSVPDEVVVKAILADIDIDPEEQIDAIFDAWLNGDTSTMSEVFFRGPYIESEIEPLYEKLVYERNVKMAEKIDGFLSGDDIYFVVVGAAHLIGENGLVNLMDKRGYQVEQLYNRKLHLLER